MIFGESHFSFFSRFIHLLTIVWFHKKIVVCHTGLLVAVYCASFEGVSDEYNETTCPHRCSEMYRPFCGENNNGETQMFPNECYMSMVNCGKSIDEGLNLFNLNRSTVEIKKNWNLSTCFSLSSHRTWKLPKSQRMDEPGQLISHGFALPSPKYLHFSPFQRNSSRNYCNFYTKYILFGI